MEEKQIKSRAKPVPSEPLPECPIVESSSSPILAQGYLPQHAHLVGPQTDHSGGWTCVYRGYLGKVAVMGERWLPLPGCISPGTQHSVAWNRLIRSAFLTHIAWFSIHLESVAVSAFLESC